MEEVYSKAWYLGKRGRFREYKSGGGRVWGDIECRSKATREVRYDRRERF